MIAEALDPLNVLLVEDSPADARLVRELLDEADAPATVTHTERLSDALAHLRRGGFNVVLLDLSLPDSSGLDTFVRARKEAPTAPIVVLTGLADPSLAAWAVREGAQDYLIKGQYDGHALFRTMRHAVERQSATAALRASEQRFRQLVENIHEAFVLLDTATGEVRYVSHAWEDVWGQPMSDAYRGLPAWLTRVEDADRDLARGAFDAAARGQRVNVSFRLRRHDDAIGWVRVRLVPVHDPSGPADIVGLVADITDERYRDAQLVQAQRMEAVGRLAGGVAHDFNNLLTVIIGSATLLEDDLDPQHPARQRLREITAAAESAASLTSQLLSFSRQNVAQPRLLSLDAVIGHAETLLQRLIGDDITLTFTAGSAPWAVHADTAQLEQVLINLVANARDAMPNGGHIAVATTEHRITAAEAARTPGVKAGCYVRLTVTDSGSGMDTATQGRIFEPFFTTKTLGKGTGLGLATVYGIVKQNLGWIGVDSVVGRGTTFTVLLPAHEWPAPDHTSSAPVESPSLRGTETILVVEDRADTRWAICEILRRHGYHVLEANDGAGALAMSRETSHHIDLVLTDVVMPGVNGRELATALCAERPTLRVLFMSGYPNDVIGRHGILDANVAFVQKPFLSNVLLTSIRRLLG